MALCERGYKMFGADLDPAAAALLGDTFQTAALSRPHTSGFRIGGGGHTHIKTSSYLYAVLVPWAWLYPTIAFRKERDSTQRAANREIRRALFSRSLLFGENVMIAARRSG